MKKGDLIQSSSGANLEVYEVKGDLVRLRYQNWFNCDSLFTYSLTNVGYLLESGTWKLVGNVGNDTYRLGFWVDVGKSTLHYPDGTSREATGAEVIMWNKIEKLWESQK